MIALRNRNITLGGSCQQWLTWRRSCSAHMCIWASSESRVLRFFQRENAGNISPLKMLLNYSLRPSFCPLGWHTAGALLLAWSSWQLPYTHTHTQNYFITYNFSSCNKNSWSCHIFITPAPIFNPLVFRLFYHFYFQAPYCYLVSLTVKFAFTFYILLLLVYLTVISDFF